MNLSMEQDNGIKLLRQPQAFVYVFTAICCRPLVCIFCYRNASRIGQGRFGADPCQA
jgi:hypothetical protein